MATWPFSLESRVALITGAASGIGAATARMFAEAGADVALAWHPPDGHDIELVRRDCVMSGARVIIGEVDVRRQADLDGLAARAVSELGSLDIVVANAGITRVEPVPEHLGEEDWDLILDINLSGVWRSFKAGIPHMRLHGYGRLIATTSVSGAIRSWSRHTAYTASKAGIVGLVKTLAVDLGPTGITVNAVAPGLIETPQSLDAQNSLGPSGVAKEADLIPVRRVGTPSDIAAANLYLASEQAGFVNGHVLIADGGRWLTSGRRPSTN